MTGEASCRNMEYECMNGYDMIRVPRKVIVVENTGQASRVDSDSRPFYGSNLFAFLVYNY